MLLLLENIYSQFVTFCYEDLDPRLANLPFTGSPMPMFIVVTAYLWFVNGRGQRWMKSRKPFELTRIINCYNIFQVFANAYVCYMVIVSAPKVQNFRLFCMLEPKHDFTKEAGTVVQIAYTFFALKLLDLFDTVFFILRKKNKQVSFLHIYHHAGIVVLYYFYLKYTSGGGTATIFALLNSFMHSVMYGYYFLTSYKPEMKNSLWWKKYITQLQMLQFVCILIYGTIALFFVECNNSFYYGMVGLLQAVVMLALFSDFYRKTYLKKKIASAANEKLQKEN